MKALTVMCASSLVVLCSTVARAQDPVKTDASHYKVMFENATVRVLRVDYAAGSKSVAHSHPDALIVALTPAKVQFMVDGKPQDSDLAVDTVTVTPAVTHSVTNMGKATIDGILIEFKGAPGKATLPASREGLAMKMLAESPRAVAYRVTADPKFQEAAGSKHDYDQVVISLSSGQMSLAIDGKPAKTTWARGDAQFIGRGVAHEAKNASGKPVDFVIVSIK